MLVARDLLKLDPIAGLYHPLAAYDKRHGRGYGLKEESGEGGLLEQAGVETGTDKLTREDLDDALDAARVRAQVERRFECWPGTSTATRSKGKCNKYCEYQPICRLERAVGLEEEGENGGPE